MKTISLIAICLLFINTSCKKNSENSPTPTNSISATVNGVNEAFNAKIKASETNIGGINVLLITGSETFDTNSAAINIEIDTSAAITTGTYSAKTGTPQGFNSGATISYVRGYMALYPSLNSGLLNSITISRISSTNVQGTFSATLSGSALGLSPTTKTITNGKFNVTIK